MIRRLFKRLYRAVFKNRFITPLIEVRPLNVFNYIAYALDYAVYRRMLGAQRDSVSLWPQLGEKTPRTSIDPHYFHQGVWTAQKIAHAKPGRHVDVGSQADLIGFLTTLTHVTFVDLRPLPVRIANLENIKGDILHLPFSNNSVDSLSCLHVAEHVGLGRYGDRLDPDGTIKACAELSRVLAPNGNLYFSIPIGSPRTFFNAHRIHAPETIRRYFSELSLVEFSAIDDRGNVIRNANMEQLRHAKYACGLFHFTKKDPAQVQNILIIKMGAAGDVVRTTALLPGLQEKYRGATIDWLTQPRMEPLLRDNPHIDRILVAPTDAWREREYQLVINLDEEEEACRIASTTRTQRIFGAYIDGEKISYTNDAAPWFDMGLISRYGKTRADELKKLNRKTYQELCYEMLDIPYRKQEPHFPLSGVDTAFAQQFAERYGIKKNTRVIGINPGSSKRWVDKRLQVHEARALIAGLHGKYPDAKIILFGGPEEREYISAIIEATRDLSIIDAGIENSLGQFAGLINLCSDVITSDSMALHISTALKKKVVAFFGPTSPWEIELYNLGTKILPVRGCLSCYNKNCNTPPEYDIDALIKEA